MVPQVGNETLRPLGFGPCFGRKLQTKKLIMYSPGGPFMVAPVVTSWAVAGQRMVFLHMYLQTRVTLKAFPVATPRGRSVSFPTRGTMVTYVTWDDLFWKVILWGLFLNCQNNCKSYWYWVIAHWTHWKKKKRISAYICFVNRSLQMTIAGIYELENTMG